MKAGWIGIVAGFVAFASLFFPWFTIELWTQNLGSTISFAAYLYQLSATIEGVTKSMFLIVWFNASTFILMLTTGVICLVGNRFTVKKQVMLFGASIVLALVSLVVFACGLASSSFAVERLNPGYTISQFPEGSFVLSAEQSMQYSYRYSWAIGSGFWLALATIILASVSAIVSWKRSSKRSTQK